MSLFNRKAKDINAAKELADKESITKLASALGVTKEDTDSFETIIAKANAPKADALQMVCKKLGLDDASRYTSCKTHNEAVGLLLEDVVREVEAMEAAFPKSFNEQAGQMEVSESDITPEKAITKFTKMGKSPQDALLCAVKEYPDLF